MRISSSIDVGGACARRALLLGACLLAGCHLRRQEEGPSPLDQAIDAAEEAFADRARSPEDLDAAIELWRAALAMDGKDPRVLSGLSRAYIARAYGYGAPNPQVDYETARMYAWTCMMLDPGFSARVTVEGGHVTERAARLLAARYRPCLEAEVVAWLRWVELRGPAGALDLGQIEILANRVAEAENAGQTWIGPWSKAMIHALQPDPARRQADTMHQQFELAQQAEPDLWVAAADQLIYEPTFDEARWMAMEDRAPSGSFALENRAAIARVERVRAEKADAP